MSEIIDLYNSSKYAEAIEKRAEAKEPKELVSVLFSYMSLEKYNEALDYLLTNKKEIYNAVPDLCIHVHISLLCGLLRFDDAYRVSKEYQNMPYVSQIVEEVLQGIDKQIREAEISYYKDTSIVSDDKIKQLILSKDPEDVSGALSYIRDRGINNFMNEINKVLINYPKQSIRSLYLTLLSEQGYDKEVEFNRFDKIIKVVPNQIINPLKDHFKEKLSVIESLSEKDITIKENAEKIFIQYSLVMLPESISVDDQLTFQAIVNIAEQYLYQDMPKDDKVLKKMDEIIKAIS